jgi:hypothetical protein
MNSHNTKKSACDGVCDDFTCRSRKESDLSFHILYECDVLATLGYFFLCSGKLTHMILGNIHQRSNLAFSRQWELGTLLYSHPPNQRKNVRKRVAK